MKSSKYEKLVSGLFFWFYPDGSVYEPTHKLLILADIHVGKVAHFRKNGVAIPVALNENIARLKKAFERHEVAWVIIAGDLFHGPWNNECEKFLNTLETLKGDSKITLVLGNHDHLVRTTNLPHWLEILPKARINDEIEVCHEPTDANVEKFTFCGHLHPGFKLKGKAKQGYILPSFWLTKKLCVLPAFGSFTGKWHKGAIGFDILVCTSDGVFELKKKQ
jgi:DNA ligase-associated metallophosphoesterase